MSSAPAATAKTPGASVARVAAGLALAVMAMLLLVQALVALAVKEVTDDYVRRFMGGTVLMLQYELVFFRYFHNQDGISLEKKFGINLMIFPRLCPSTVTEYITRQ